MKKTGLMLLLILLIIPVCGEKSEMEPEVKIGVMKRLTATGGNYPQWSADGTKILYSRSNRVYTISAEGTDSLLIAAIEGGEVFHPHYNPADQNQICFLNQDQETDEWEIYVTTVGGEPVKIYSQKEQITSVSFTRDGTEIAFSKGPGSTSGVWLIPPGGGETSKWPRDDAWGLIADAECAVDADLISFIEIKTGQAQNLYTLARTGGTAQRVSNFPTGTDFTQAARSWDGSKYLIRWGERIWYGTDFNIYIINSSGGEIEQVTTMTRPFDPNHPTWSPDGTKIAFSRRPSANESVNVFVIDLTK